MSVFNILLFYFKGIIMKQIITFSLLAIVLAACADTRHHVRQDATSWEHKQYEVGQTNQKIDSQQ